MSHGVETSDIRRLLDRKSHDLWKSHKSDPDGYGPLARYKVTQREKMDLIDNADPAKARPWPSYDSWLIAVALAWKRLALYGVEASEILSLLDDRQAR
ncbi:MAG TPA: hypothetical protein VNY05_25540 [Candidatus Acidoferrales bacterium]|nr:hypothetical protein [Candidatus Acidoferrales bacterium]